MKYLVTGGAGFIGSNIVEELVKQGHEVEILDNLFTGNEENIKNLTVNFHLLGTGAIGMFKKDKIDGIFHFGQPSSTPMFKFNRRLIGKTITEFIEVLELAKEIGCKVVYASTSSMYNRLPTPFKEDMNPLALDLYTEVRICMERVAKDYNDFYGVKSIGMRMFAVYGPKEKFKKQYANLVSQFLWAIEKDEQPVVYGDGSQTRDFTYVKDIVRAAILAMDSDIEYDVFNIGTGKNYTINEMIRILNKKLGKNRKAKYAGNPVKPYVEHTLASTEKAEKLLGFKAEYSLDDGLNELIKK